MKTRAYSQYNHLNHSDCLRSFKTIKAIQRVLWYIYLSKLLLEIV